MDNKTIVAFGEIMLRLSPDKSIVNATEFAASYGGTESNVLVTLSGLGNKTKYLTKLPDNGLGQGAVMHLKRYGVNCDSVISQGENMGMYFLEKGYGPRAAKVIYSRKNAEVTTLSEDDFDFDSVFENARLFHISGISFALSPSVETLCFRLLQEAKRRNIPISFDFNYRAKLWTEQQAARVYKKILPYVDIVFCSSRDLETFLNTDAQAFFGVYSKVETLVVREREILAPDTHGIKTQVYTKNGKVASAEKQVLVLERIGGGDAFAAGFIHGALYFNGDIKRTLDFAADCFALKATVEGDVLYAGEEEIKAFSLASSKDVRR